jgi:hypothetical protein
MAQVIDTMYRRRCLEAGNASESLFQTRRTVPPGSPENNSLDLCTINPGHIRNIALSRPRELCVVVIKLGSLARIGPEGLYAHQHPVF